MQMPSVLRGVAQPVMLVGWMWNTPAALVSGVVPRRMMPGPPTTARLAQAPRVLRASVALPGRRSRYRDFQ